MKISVFDLGVGALALVSFIPSANAAVALVGAPAPVIGLGGAALIGIGYRALKRRLGR